VKVQLIDETEAVVGDARNVRQGLSCVFCGNDSVSVTDRADANGHRKHEETQDVTRRIDVAERPIETDVIWATSL